MARVTVPLPEHIIDAKMQFRVERVGTSCVRASRV